MNKNCVKYLQGINFSQLIKDLGCVTPDLVISQSSSRIRTCVRKFNPAIYAKRKWLSGCAERNALLCLLVNHVIVLALAVPQTS
jgi:hypothetical protein